MPNSAQRGEAWKDWQAILWLVKVVCHCIVSFRFSLLMFNLSALNTNNQEEDIRYRSRPCSDDEHPTR